VENFRLKVFRAVAAEMSFRKAAEVLHLSQPAVSQQVRSLEEEAGSPCSIVAAAMAMAARSLSPKRVACYCGTRRRRRRR